jgi:outer membrane receptor protein involved in Fe transport
MVTMMYNIIGKRIVAVGRPSPNSWEDIPNIYEMPRNVLDLAISKKLGKHAEIKFSVKDILNEKVTFNQPVNTTVEMAEVTDGTQTGTKHFDRDQITKSFNPGRYISAGLTYKF